METEVTQNNKRPRSEQESEACDTSAALFEDDDGDNDDVTTHRQDVSAEGSQNSRNSNWTLEYQDDSTSLLRVSPQASVIVCVEPNKGKRSNRTSSLRCLECPDGQTVTMHGYRLMPGGPAVGLEEDIIDGLSNSLGWTTLQIGAGALLELYQLTVVNASAPMAPLDECNGCDAEDTQMEGGKPRKVRPTLVPPSWKQAVDKILRDFTEKQRSLVMQDEHTKIPEQQRGVPSFHRETLHHDEGTERDTAELGSADNGFQIAIAGAKGVGKSTCVRYLINRFLSSNDECDVETDNVRETSVANHVVLLDAGLQGSLIAPPGMMTLAVIDSPLLHHHHHYHHLHQHDNDSVLSLFYGSTTVQVDPERYMEYLQALLSHYLNVLLPKYRKEGVIPLCINICGSWVKGLGQSILHALIQDVLELNHMIQISGDNKSQQFDVKLEYVSAPSESSLPQLSDAPIDHQMNSSPPPPFVVHKAYAYHSCRAGENSVEPTRYFDDQDKKESLPMPSALSIASSQIRALRLCLYFLQATTTISRPTNGDTGISVWKKVRFGQQYGGLEDPECAIANALAAARPYRIAWRQVQIRFAFEQDHGDIGISVSRGDISNSSASSSMLYAINGSIVGLCQRDDNLPLSGRQAADVDMMLCYGLGIVRSIDLARQLCYVLTPVDSSILQKVNIICKGRITLPLECYFRGVASESFPYQSMEGKNNPDLLGSEPMLSRNNIMRKSMLDPKTETFDRTVI